MSINRGDEVEITSNRYKKVYGFVKGTKGWVVSIAQIEDKEYVFFMPDGVERFFVISSEYVKTL